MLSWKKNQINSLSYYFKVISKVRHFSSQHFFFFFDSDKFSCRQTLKKDSVFHFQHSRLTFVLANVMSEYYRPIERF